MPVTRSQDSTVPNTYTRTRYTKQPLIKPSIPPKITAPKLKKPLPPRNTHYLSTPAHARPLNTTKRTPKTPSSLLKYPNSYNITLNSSPSLTESNSSNITPEQDSPIHIDITTPSQDGSLTDSLTEGSTASPTIPHTPETTTTVTKLTPASNSEANHNSPDCNANTSPTAQPSNVSASNDSEPTPSPKSKLPKHAAPIMTPHPEALLHPVSPHSTTPNNPETIRDTIFTLKTQQAKAVHHMSFLNTCTHDNLIPHGFRITLSPQVMNGDASNIENEWEDTLIDTSKKLMQLTVTHYTSLLATFTEKIEELESLLDTLQIDPAPLTNIQTDRLAQLQQKLENTRNKKTHALKDSNSAAPQPATRPHRQQGNTNSPQHFLPPPQKHRPKKSMKHAPIMPLMRKTLLPTPSTYTSSPQQSYVQHLHSTHPQVSSQPTYNRPQTPLYFTPPQRAPQQPWSHQQQLPTSYQRPALLPYPHPTPQQPTHSQPLMHPYLPQQSSYPQPQGPSPWQATWTGAPQYYHQ